LPGSDSRGLLFVVPDSDTVLFCAFSLVSFMIWPPARLFGIAILLSGEGVRVEGVGGVLPACDTLIVSLSDDCT
jgi:hypothetical protein